MSGCTGPEDRAAHRADFRHEPGVRRECRAGAASLPHTAPHRAPRQRMLHLLAVDPQHGLQGHAHEPTAQRIFHRPDRQMAHERDGYSAFALLDQHLPAVEPCAAFQDALPQRGDKHHTRQPQLDEGQGERAQLRRTRRHLRHNASAPARHERFGQPRQCARIPDDERSEPAPGDVGAGARKFQREESDIRRSACIL